MVHESNCARFGSRGQFVKFSGECCDCIAQVSLSTKNTGPKRNPHPPKRPVSSMLNVLSRLLLICLVTEPMPTLCHHAELEAITKCFHLLSFLFLQTARFVKQFEKYVCEVVYLTNISNCMQLYYCNCIVPIIAIV